MPSALPGTSTSYAAGFSDIGHPWETQPQEVAASPFPAFKEKSTRPSIIYPKEKVPPPQLVLWIIGSKSIDNEKESKAGLEDEVVKE